MRRFLAVMATLAALVSLSGCFKLDMDLTVNSDDTMDGVVILALNKDLAGMADQSSDLKAEDLPEGATIETYDEGGFVGQKVTLKGVSMDDLNTSFSSESDTGGPGEWSLTHEGDEYRFSGDMDMTEMASTGDDALDMSAFMEGAELRVALTFPGEITDSNGAVDGSTVVWEPKVGEKNEMTAVAVEDSGLSTPAILLIGGAAVVALLVLAGILLSMRSRKRSAGSVEPSGADGPHQGPPAGGPPIS